jgi:hypothetical protein
MLWYTRNIAYKHRYQYTNTNTINVVHPIKINNVHLVHCVINKLSAHAPKYSADIYALKLLDIFANNSQLFATGRPCHTTTLARISGSNEVWEFVYPFTTLFRTSNSMHYLCHNVPYVPYLGKVAHWYIHGHNASYVGDDFLSVATH